MSATEQDAIDAIERQNGNEDLIAQVFRLHILRFWSRERVVKFCLDLLGDDYGKIR